MKTIINPLLEILAATGVDYCAFFRAISNFSCSEAKYNISISYQPEGIHSEQSLRTSNPTDCLGLILKSLLALRDEERKYLDEEIEKLKKEMSHKNESEKNESKNQKTFDPATFPQLKPLPFPTLEEISVTWKFWTQTYRMRLLGQTSTEITQDDAIRQRQLKKSVNPKYLPRNYIMNQVFQEIYEKIPPVVEKKLKRYIKLIQ